MRQASPIHHPSAQTAAAAVRQHWGIENNPGVFARLRSFAYNILKSNQTDTIPRDRLAAAFGGLKSIFSMTFSKER